MTSLTQQMWEVQLQKNNFLVNKSPPMSTACFPGFTARRGSVNLVINVIIHVASQRYTLKEQFLLLTKREYNLVTLINLVSWQHIQGYRHLNNLNTAGLQTSFFIGSYHKMFTCSTNYIKALKCMHHKFAYMRLFLSYTLSDWVIISQINPF